MSGVDPEGSCSHQSSHGRGSSLILSQYISPRLAHHHSCIIICTIVPPSLFLLAQCLTKDPRARPTAKYMQQHRFAGSITLITLPPLSLFLLTQCLTKDPRARPTAKYMQQHRFAGQYRWPDVERALLPMMEACRLFLAEAAPEELQQQQAEEAAAAAAAGGARGAMDGMATGHFSWRMPPEGTGEDYALASPLHSLLLLPLPSYFLLPFPFDLASSFPSAAPASPPPMCMCVHSACSPEAAYCGAGGAGQRSEGVTGRRSFCPRWPDTERQV